MAKTNADGSKSLGRGDLLAIAIGNVIGGGVMTMTGLAIGITGRSIVLSYIICAVMVTIVALPQFFLSGTIRMNGGFYTQAAMFGGKWFAGLYSVVFVSYFFGATMYSASFADYVLSAFPEINGKLVAFGILTVFVVLNLCGIQVAAKVQYALVIILVIALLLFTGFGIIHLEPGYFDENQFFTSGFTGVMSAAALLSMATSGATFIINMSREAKNPKKDIPFCIVVGTVIVTILYIGVGVVAAGRARGRPEPVQGGKGDPSRSAVHFLHRGRCYGGPGHIPERQPGMAAGSYCPGSRGRLVAEDLCKT